jgi:hypothetical protein
VTRVGATGHGMLTCYTPMSLWRTMPRSRCSLAVQPEGDDIVQECRDADGTLRQWCFTEITDGPFRWLAVSPRTTDSPGSCGT